MSGIAGIQKKGEEKIVDGMLNKIVHRGPDGRQTASAGSCVLGAVRLAAGPFDAAGPFAKNGKSIVWDGEVYDFEALRNASGSGAETDGEWILERYVQEGPEFFGRMNGPFAVAITDGDDLILARDSLGQAPLYYGTIGGRLCFASEIKAIHDVADDVRPFPPGHYMKGGEITPLPAATETLPADSDAGSIAVGLLDRLERSVRRRVAHAPRMGVWLSGGLDSSVLASLAVAAGRPVLTFSAGVKGAPDIGFARDVASFLGTEHHERLCTVEEMMDILPQVIYHLESFDGPLIRSSVANYLVAGAASEHVRTVLSGEGSDELFAGYSFLKNRDEASLRAGLSDAQGALYNTALQRVDRSASAFGTRARTAFLDPEVVAFANAIPGTFKVHGPEQTEKWILRKAIEGRLPESVVWRPKEKFWAGSGISTKLAEFAESGIADGEFAAEREILPGYVLESKEELHYWRIFRRWFPRVNVMDNLGRTIHREPR
jgi:asparagine synthase (glutamine-hydrolysing)